jgi:hypothetical protein
MSNIKNALSLYTLAAMSAMNDFTDPIGGYDHYKKVESESEKKARLEKSKTESNKSKGLKEFIYGENSVWAINKKNADKKAKKNNWI